MTELWTDADSLAAAIDAAPDSFDLRAAYIAEARMVLGEDRVAHLGEWGAILELGKVQATQQQTGELPAHATVHEQVSLITAKRLLPIVRAHPELLDAQDDQVFMDRAEQFRDVDPSGLQWGWAMRACRAVLAAGDVPERPHADAGRVLPAGEEHPRPMFP